MTTRGLAGIGPAEAAPAVHALGLTKFPERRDRLPMLSPDQAKKRYQDHMGAEAGAAFYHVVGEVAGLHAKWGDYTGLFGKPNRVDLLNEAAPDFFGRLQYTLLDDVMLHLARLTDKPATGKKSNLSIKGLVRLLPDKDHREALDSQIGVMDRRVEACRDRRDRRLAHNDYPLAVGTSPLPLLPASRASIREAIDSVTEVVNAISVHYLDAEMAYDFDEIPATDLLYVLYEGVRAAEGRKARLAAGEFVPPSDFPPNGL